MTVTPPPGIPVCSNPTVRASTLAAAAPTPVTPVSTLIAPAESDNSNPIYENTSTPSAAAPTTGTVSPTATGTDSPAAAASTSPKPKKNAYQNIGPLAELMKEQEMLQQQGQGTGTSSGGAADGGATAEPKTAAPTLILAQDELYENTNTAAKTATLSFPAAATATAVASPGDPGSNAVPTSGSGAPNGATSQKIGEEEYEVLVGVNQPDAEWKSAADVRDVTADPVYNVC